MQNKKNVRNFRYSRKYMDSGNIPAFWNLFFPSPFTRGDNGKAQQWLGHTLHIAASTGLLYDQLSFLPGASAVPTEPLLREQAYLSLSWSLTKSTSEEDKFSKSP